MTEVWKGIENAAGRYPISNQGRYYRPPYYESGKNRCTGKIPMEILELSKDQVHEIKERLRNGEYIHSIAEVMGISRKTVGRIKSGRSYAWAE